MSKKCYNIVLAVTAFVLMCAVLSCKRNNVTKIKTDNKFAIPLLVGDTITVRDALNMIDSTWNSFVFTDENGALYYVYVADTAKDVVSGEKLLNEIDEIDIDVSGEIDIQEIAVPEEVYEIRDLIASGGGVPPTPFSYEFKLDTTILIPDFPKLPFAVENFSILKVVMKSGSIDFLLDVDGFDENMMQCWITVMSSAIVDGDGPFSLVVGNHGNVLKDLAGCTITPVNDSVEMQANIRIVVPSVIFDENTTLSQLDEYISAVESIGGSHGINLLGSISGLRLKSVEGIVNVPSIRYRGVVEDIEFNLENVTGDLNVNKPNVIIKYLNTFGFGVQANVDTMQLRTKKDSADINILKTESITFELQQTPSYKDLDVTGEIIDYIDVLEEYEKFTYSGDLKIIDEDAIGVYEDSHLDIATIMNIKLGMKINELVYCDTLDMDVGEMSVRNYINEFDFKFNLTNGLPVELELQAYLMENGVVTDSLFDETNNKIPSGFGGEPMNTTNIVAVTAERLDNVMNADKLIFKIRLTTTGQEVVFRATDMVVVSIGLMTKTTEIDIDDVL